MFRLKSLLTFTVAASVSAVAIAQLSAPDSAAASRFAVVGDVLSPDTYESPAGSTVSLRDALNAAGMMSATSHVLVIRSDGVQVHQRSEIVADSSVSTASQLTPGDAVVVYAVGPASGTIRPSAALIDGARVCGLTLEGSQVAVGDLLVHCGVSRDRSGFVQLHSLVPGRGRTRVDLREIVQHGDVVVVGRPAGAATADQTRFSPRVSEFREGGIHSGDPLSAGSLMLTSERQEPAGEQELAREPVGDSVNVGVSARGVSLQSAPEELPPSAAPAPELPNSDTRIMSDAGEAAPVPPAEVSLVGDHATAYSLWKVIFVGGLLISGGLVTAGWLMSEAELRQHTLTAAIPAPVSRDTLTPETPGVSFRVERSVPEQLQTPAASPSAHLLQSQEHLRNAAAGGLVAQHEWYGTDWQTTVAQSPQAASSNAAENPVKLPEAAVNQPELLNGAGILTAAESFSDLTDLIRNRLPVDLCDAKLPLRVSLFGHAAGPRRLRIDAAHTQLTPPHFRSGSGGSTARPTAVSAGTTAPSSVPSQESDLPGAAGTGPVATRSQADVRQNRESGAGSLDRALSFLQEQDA